MSNYENVPKSHGENIGSARDGYDYYQPQAAGQDLFQKNALYPLRVGRQIEKTIPSLSHLHSDQAPAWLMGENIDVLPAG